MKNLLTLLEAIILMLMNQSNKTATYEITAKEMDNRNLFPDRKNGNLLSQQIKLRNSISTSNFKH